MCRVIRKGIIGMKNELGLNCDIWGDNLYIKMIHSGFDVEPIYRKPEYGFGEADEDGLSSLNQLVSASDTCLDDELFSYILPITTGVTMQVE